MSYILRAIEPRVKNALNRGKSILLLGARQTGKTTFIERQIKPDISYSFANLETRLRYEKNPALLGRELEAQITSAKMSHKPLVAIDEIQKIPLIMDSVQDLIDRKIAQFILTGSSARKLKYGHNINLLPGRIVTFKLDPLMHQELPASKQNIKDLLMYGSLPGILCESSLDDKNLDLDSYSTTYLEEEIRAEAIVRNIGNFARFLELAANESGCIVNLSKLAQEIGVTHVTIAAYYQILEDCLIVEKVEALSQSKTRRKLNKAAKHLFFDLGVRRLCSGEGAKLSQRALGILFEQFIGLEFIRHAHILHNKYKVRYWRDHSGPEVDFVLETNENYIPIEVKWTAVPTASDCRHLNIFIDEYKNVKHAFVICQTPKKFFITKNILALPWQELDYVINDV